MIKFVGAICIVTMREIFFPLRVSKVLSKSTRKEGRKKLNRMTARLSNGSIYLLAVGIVYTTKKQKKKPEKKPTPRAYTSQEKWFADPSSVGEKDVLRDASRQ